MRFKSKKFGAVLLLFVCVFGSAFFLLRGDGKASYLEAACTFEGLPADCLDTLPAWNAGLDFFDGALSKSRDTVEAVKALLWDFWGLEFAGMDFSDSPSSVLPLRVLQGKRSGCVGAVFLAEMLGDARKIRIEAILLPSHVFFRVNGVNLEPNRRGHSYTDAEYRQKYAQGPWTGFEFSPLTGRQFLGIVAFDLGNWQMPASPEKALAWYKVAAELFPQYPGISVNRRAALESLE